MQVGRPMVFYFPVLVRAKIVPFGRRSWFFSTFVWVHGRSIFYMFTSLGSCIHFHPMFPAEFAHVASHADAGVLLLPVL